jgi:serine/threonine protein kinase
MNNYSILNGDFGVAFHEATGTEVLFRKGMHLKKEIESLCLIGNHDHIVRLIDFSLVDEESTFICLENFPLNLVKCISKEIQLDEVGVMLNIAFAMQFVHSKGFIHRNITSCNIFIDNNGKAKIGGFELATSLGDHDFAAETGSYRYMAPEIIQHTSYSFSADVYSFGMYTWVFILGSFDISSFFNDFVYMKGF